MEDDSTGFWCVLFFVALSGGFVAFIVLTGLAPRNRIGSAYWVKGSEEPVLYWIVFSVVLAFAVACLSLFIYGWLTGDWAPLSQKPARAITPPL